MRKWLLESKSQTEAFTRARAFLYALFVVLLRYLKKETNSDGKSLPSIFRLLMTTGQTFSDQGPKRIQFYDEVLILADEVLILLFLVLL